MTLKNFLVELYLNIMRRGHFNTKSENSWTSNLNTDLLINTKRHDLSITGSWYDNKPFEDCLWHLYGEWLLSGKCPSTPVGHWSTAWQAMSIIRKFKKWCVSDDVNGTENHVLWKEVMKNILPVMKVMAVAS